MRARIFFFFFFFFAHLVNKRFGGLKAKVVMILFVLEHTLQILLVFSSILTVTIE